MSVHVATCSTSSHFRQKLPIQLLNGGVPELQWRVNSRERSHATHSKLRCVLGNLPVGLCNGELFPLKGEYLALGACTSGTRRSQQKSASDRKIARKLSNLIRNVAVPELQSTVKSGETRSTRVSMLRLRIRNAALIEWERSVDLYRNESEMGGVLRGSIGSVEWTLWERCVTRRGSRCGWE
jgi:hypothetical protein